MVRFISVVRSFLSSTSRQVKILAPLDLMLLLNCHTGNQVAYVCGFHNMSKQTLDNHNMLLNSAI